jgi:hypothetical protein
VNRPALKSYLLARNATGPPRRSFPGDSFRVPSYAPLAFLRRSLAFPVDTGPVIRSIYRIATEWCLKSPRPCRGFFSSPKVTQMRFVSVSNRPAFRTRLEAMIRIGGEQRGAWAVGNLPPFQTGCRPFAFCERCLMSRFICSPAPSYDRSDRPIRVGIFRDGELSHVTVVPDLRGSFVKSFNEDWGDCGLTARIVSDDVKAPEEFSSLVGPAV